MTRPAPAGGEPLFTFAVLSDSHVNETEDRSASPYASNRLANARLRFAVDSINRQRPAFVAHLGDMANPLPELTTYGAAAANFHAIAGGLEAPLRLVPGNHCVGDKPVGWVPVPRVCVASLRRYEELYGRDRYAFEHAGCHFVAVDSLLVNSGLERETEQRQWLEESLGRAAAAGRRLFVLMHYPAFVVAPDEPASYDNLDEPGRSWLLGLFERHGVEAAFSGHVHNYFVNRWAGTTLYTLPATSFVRQDYAELFPVAPEDDEGGRNDGAKLGYGLVDVFERGHRCRVVRTYGRGLAPGESLEPPPTLPGTPPLALAGVGVEMRDHWLSRSLLRPNNSVSPFSRRWARNDWAILALAEAGVARVRLPLEELEDAGVPERLAALGTLGFEFLAYSFGVPTAELTAGVLRHRDLLSGWELIASREEIAAAAEAVGGRLAAERGASALPLYWSEARGVEREQIDDANVKHLANYGFDVDQLDRAERLWRDGPVATLCAGLVFRVRRRGAPEVSPWEAIRAIDRWGSGQGMRNQVHLLFSGNLTAERFDDDLATANRVAEAALGALVAESADVYLDTFEDVDRGYFVRHGLVDRRYNPRPAARVLRHLHTALGSYRFGPGWSFRREDHADGRQITGRRGDWAFCLVLPARRWGWRPPPEWSPAGELLAVDLESGTLAASGDAGSAPPAFRRPVDRPLLVTSKPAR